MGIRSTLKSWLAPRLKAADSFIPALPSSWLVGLPRTDYPFQRDIGQGLLSSVVMPVVQFLMRSFPEAPLVVRATQEDELQVVADHPLPALIDRPNAFYPGVVLWMCTILDWCLFGESYWRILANRGGEPAELWWLPPWSIEPRWPQDGSAFISSYSYRPDLGTAIELDLEEVIHFRHGLDPRNPRHGLPPLRAVLREVWSDDESANWVASLLRNMGIPGMILSPKGEQTSLSAEDVERIKEYVRGRFTGDHRGEPLAFGSPTDVTRLAWSPSDLNMSVVRDTAEERVCSALGVPAAVVGFGTGLDSTKVGATMREYVRLAWTNGLIPLQRLMAAELQRTLLPQFETRPERFQVGWNYDEVAALEEDQNALAERLDRMVRGGWLKVGEARQAMGYEASEDDDIYLRSATVQAVDPADQLPEPIPPPAALPAAANGQPAMNGNGMRNGDGAVQQRALTKQGTLDEWLTQVIGQSARRLDKPPAAMLRAAARLWKEQARVSTRFEAMIRQVFERYGAAAATAAREILKPQKASAADTVRTAIISERLPLLQVRAELAGVYRELYQAMLDLVLKSMATAGHPELTNPARVSAQLGMLAHERTGLMDLTSEARTAILKTLEEATAAGWDEDQMIAAIRDSVPRGRWLSVDARAQIIARTESRYAAAMATSAYAREQGMHLLVLDAQLGETDATCMERAGWIVSPSQGVQLAASEHPNGTLQLISLPAAAVTA